MAPVIKTQPGVRVFHILALTLFGATFIPLLSFVLIWRFYYAGNSNAALGLAQIRNALEGSTRLLELHERPSGTAGNPETESRLKLLLNGPVVRLRVGPSTPEQALRVLGSVLDVSPLRISGDSIECGPGEACGRKERDGSWSITGARTVAAGAAAWDSLDEAGRRDLANQTPYLRVTRDSSQAIIKLGSTGYIWAITAAYTSDAPCFELFHPQLEAVEVTWLTNARGERVGAEIGSLHGCLSSSERGEVIRYDYYWKNPDDSGDRKKVVLMRHVDGWNAILCAGLYEDEFYLPTKTAEAASVLSIVRGRVNSMALVYQQLLGANEYAALPFNDYIEGILAYHQSGHSRQPGNAVREQHLEAIAVGFDIAVPFGLIVNELVSNAFRHGVSTRYASSILIELFRDGEFIAFKVQDNGDGMSEGTDERTGLLLVRALCTQLHGTLSIQSPATADGGTVAIVRVPAGSRIAVTGA